MGALPVFVIMLVILVLSVVIGYFGFPKRSGSGKRANSYISNPIRMHVGNVAADDSTDLVIDENFEICNYDDII